MTKRKPRARKAPTPAPPDYTQGCGRTGGHLADVVPQPVQRMWPGALATGRKRPVRVNIMRYQGMGVHYYASLHEEDNPVWQTRLEPPYTTEPHWVRPWDDEAGRGRLESKRCNTVREAERYINHMLRLVFPPATHKPEFMYEDDYKQVNGRWYYKEGD